MQAFIQIVAARTCNIVATSLTKKLQKLICAVTSKQSKQHYKILQKVLAFIKDKKDCTKLEAVQYRDKLLANSQSSIISSTDFMYISFFFEVIKPRA